MKIRPAILFIAFAVPGLLGTWGFQQLHPGNGWLTALYQSIGLFTLQTGVVHGTVPWPLEIARWLAPFVTLTGLFAAANALFQGFRDWWRLFFSRAHTIICGAGEKGATLASDLLSSRQKTGTIVIVERDSTVPALADLRRRGAVLVQGDAREAGILEGARVSRAAKIVCAAGDDGTNLAIAMQAAKLAPVKRSGHLLCIYAQVADETHRDVLQRHRAFELDSRTRHRIRLFNDLRNQARTILKACPLEVDNAGEVADEVHLVVPGAGALPRAVLLHAGRVGHYRDGGKVTVHIVAEAAAQEYRHVLKDYPQFEKCAGLVAHVLEANSDFTTQTAGIIAALPAGAFTSVFLSGHDEHEALAEALILREHLPRNERFRVLLAAAEGSVVHDIVSHSAQHSGSPLSRWIRFIPTHRQACGREAVFEESLDRVARRIHEVWYAETSNAIREVEQAEAEKLASKPTYRRWEELSEEQKDANRFAADHVEIKIRAIGLDPSRQQEWSDAWGRLSEQELELLSRMEHERWCALKWLAGWQKGPRDEARRFHDNLVPYDDLDEMTKDYDRTQAQKAVEYLKVDMS